MLLLFFDRQMLIRRQADSDAGQQNCQHEHDFNQRKAFVCYTAGSDDDTTPSTEILMTSPFGQVLLSAFK